MQINFNGTNFISTQLSQRIFSVWPVAQPVVGEIEMHSVANLATSDPFSNFLGAMLGLSKFLMVL